MKKTLIAVAALLLAGPAAALTANRVVKASSATYITDSIIRDNGSAVGIGTDTVAGATLTVNGPVKSLSGGFVFPDGSTQTAAGLTMGGAVSGGGASRILFLDGSQNLASDAKLTFNASGLGALIVESASPSGGTTANFTNTAGTNNQILNLTNQVANSTAAVKFNNDFATWGVGVGGDDAFFVYDQAQDVRVLAINYNSASPTHSARGKIAVAQPTLGSSVLELSSTATNDDPLMQVRQGRTATTNGSATQIFSVTLDTDSVYLIKVHIVGRRTGGAAGSAGDGYGGIIAGVFKNVGGSASQIGSTTVVAEGESQAAFGSAFVAGGPGVTVQVTGAANNDISWHCTAFVTKIAS